MRAIQQWWASRPPSSRRAWELAALLAIPLLVETALLSTAWRDGILGIDMKQSLLPAAQVIRDGFSPFARTHYPPLLPVLLVPFTFLPSAAIVVSGLALATVAATLWVLQVRDWRCYGAAFLWAPVVSGIQTANATLFLVLASALAWRYRDRAGATAAATGLAIAAKLISWPLVAWLAATGRLRGAVGAVAIAVVSTIGLGALLEVALRHTDTEFGEIAGSAGTPSYSVVDVSRSLGASASAALVALGFLTLATVLLCVVLGRRGDDVGSFSVACLACLVGAPNVWLHTFALVLPIVALTRPRFSVAWLVPALFLVLPVANPSAAEVVFAWFAIGVFVLRLIGPPPFGRIRVIPQVATRGPAA
jgi:Glycosyltransferase family 87